MDAAESSEARRRYNVLATFPDRSAAEEAAGALRRSGMSEATITLHARQDQPEVSEAEMRDELEGMLAGPIVASKTMTEGSVAGAIIGAIVGVVIGLIVGLAVFASRAGAPRAVGIVASVVAFGAGLSVAGALAGGFAKPRYKPDPADVAAGDQGPRGGPGEPGRPEGTADQVVVSVHVDDEEALTASEDVLASANPMRLDVVGRQGEVLNTRETGLGDLPVQPGSGRVRDPQD